MTINNDIFRRPDMQRMEIMAMSPRKDQRAGPQDLGQALRRQFTQPIMPSSGMPSG